MSYDHTICVLNLNWLLTKASWTCMGTANLNEKNLATNSSWDFDANFETSDPSWSIPDPKFFSQSFAPAANPGYKNGVA